MTLHSDIDKLFREGLSDYSEKAPGFVWDNIEGVLNKKRKARQRSLIYGMAAAVALLLSFGSGYWLTNLNLSQGLVAEQKPKPTSTFNEETTQQPVQSVQTPVNIQSELQIIQSESSKTQQKEAVKSQPEKHSVPAEKSIIKKATSSGTLLPPMFANEDNYSQEQAPVFQPKAEEVSETSDLATIQPKGLDETSNLDERTLVYRQTNQLTLPDEYFIAPDEDNKKISSWSVAMNASPLVSYRDVYSVNNQVLATADNVSSLEKNYQNEKPLVSYVAGVDVNYKMSKRWNIQGGVYLSEIGQLSSDIGLTSSTSSYTNSQNQSYSINTSSGNIVVNASSNELVQILDPKAKTIDAGIKLPGSFNNTQKVTTDFVQAYRYYELPLMVNYRLIDRKLSMNVTGGVSANVLYDQQVYMQKGGERYSLDAQVEDIKKMNYNGILGLGFDYPVVSGLHVNVQPTLRYSLTAINTDGTVYPYSFGVFTGLIYNF